MSRSSEYHLGASSSSPPPSFRQFGEFSEKEECDVIAKKKKKATIEQQQQKGMVEPDTPQMQGLAAQSSFNHSGPTADSEPGIMSYTVLVEPDAPQMQGVAAKSSFNRSGPMADSTSEIMSYAVLIILLVPAVIFGLDVFAQNV